MKSLKIILPLLLSILLISCSKDEVNISEDVLYYANLEVGNYWVYDWYELTSEGESLLHENDTVRILSETIISGQTFFVKSPHKYGAGNLFLFDSLNAIYSYPARQIFFTLDDNAMQTIDLGPMDEPITTGTYQLRGEEEVDVPAGSFQCLNWRGVYVSNKVDYEFGDRFNDNYFAKNVGLIQMRTQFYSSPNDLEARLISYGNLSNN
ncbi:MAG: hypothetical protein AB8B73_14670 [Ekhidna sp.]